MYIKHFSSAQSKCMKDYSKPSLRDPHDNFILHVGTNDLRRDESLATIVKSVIGIKVSFKNKKENHDISISNIIVRRDNQ